MLRCVVPLKSSQTPCRKLPPFPTFRSDRKQERGRERGRMGGGEDSGERWLRWLWEHASIFVLRPLLAIFFVLSLIVLSWFVAWKTVLVHVPIVQEICGLRKKPVKPKPTNLHRISRFYHSNPSLRNNRSKMEEKSS